MAGQDVQQLLLQIDATTELMRRELAKAAAETDQWATRTEGAVNRASGSFDAMAGAANFAKGAIGGFIASISIGTLVQGGRAILEFADSLDAAAEKAGLSAERYQTLKEGLRALEVDGDKADSIFQRLQDTLGAVQGGTAAGGVTAALDKMGVTSRILNGEITDTAGLFDAIAGSAGKFGSQAEFVAAVVDIVGRKLGVDLATAIKDGGKALKEQEDAFRGTGMVISEEYIKRLADANEEIAQFTVRSKSRLTIWAAETLGILKTVNDGFIGVADVYRREGAISAFASLFDEGTNKRGQNIRVQREILSTRFDPSANGLPGFDKPARIAEGGGGRPAVSSGGAGSAKATVASLTAAQLREGGYDNSVKSLPIIPFGVTDPAIVALDGVAERLRDIQALTGDLSKARIIDPEQAAIAQKFTDDLSRGLGQAIIFGQNIGDALVNSIKAAAAELISSQLLKLLGGGSGTGGLLGAVASGIGSLFGGGRAAGGPVQAGTPYLVGENRPEIFIPSTRGRIAPRVPEGAGGSATDVRIKVEPSEAFVTTVAVTSATAGQQAAAEAFRSATRSRMPSSRGA